MTSLEDRAVVALRGADTGQAFTSFAELHALSPDAVRGFLEALAAVAARRGLVVETSIIDASHVAVPGIAFRWRPA